MQQSGKVAVRWGEWIGEGWQMFVERWPVWVVDLLILVAAIAVVAVPMYALVIAAAISAQGQDQPPQVPAVLFLFYLIVIPYIMLVTAFLSAGCYHTAMKQLRGEAISVGDIFGGGRYFLRMLVATFIIGIATSVGAMLCILPGFLVMGMFFFTFPLIIERGLGPIEAMSTSFSVTRTNLVMFTLFAFVVHLLAGAGSMACGIGALVTYPLLFTVTAVAYRDCFGVAGARHFGQTAPPPPPNYNPSYGQSYGAPPNYPPPSPQTPPQTYGTVTCPHCQSTVSANSAFCPRCGGNVRG